MNLYVETSALLSWLLAEPEAVQVANVLSQTQTPVSCELTLAECRRALTRLNSLGQIGPAELAARRSVLESQCAGWHLSPVSSRLLADVQTAFPVEPVRTLDALHLCAALALRLDFPGLSLLSLDRRVRDNGAALGFTVFP